MRGRIVLLLRLGALGASGASLAACAAILGFEEGPLAGAGDDAAAAEGDAAGQGVPDGSPDHDGGGGDPWTYATQRTCDLTDHLYCFEK